MSRDANGNYVLPPGNPVQSGTVIEAVWANTTMSDLGPEEITDSLSRSGKGGMIAPLKLVDGSVDTPSLTFNSDFDIGLFKPAEGQVGVAIDGVNQGNFSALGFQTTLATVTDLIPVDPGHLVSKFYLEQLIDGADFVERSGDTMTGFLTLFDDATDPLHAVTLQQMESADNDLQSDIDGLAGNTLNTSDSDILQLRSGVAGGLVDSLPLSTEEIFFDIKTQNNSSPADSLVQLDAAGKIPLDLLPAGGVNIVGFWNPNVDGSTPPALPGTFATGDAYLFSAAGDMTLFESDDQTPHTIAVISGDMMIALIGESGFVDGWYYMSNPFGGSSADLVTFDNTGTNYIAQNVQEALEEIDGVFGTNRMVKSAGDTMTGNLTISKSNAILYLDGVGEGLRLIADDLGNLEFQRMNVSGGFLNNPMRFVGSNGAVEISYDGAVKLATISTGVAITGQATVSDAAPTAANHLTRKDYVDTEISDAIDAAPYLPIAGGTMTGGLIIDEGASDSELQLNSTVNQARFRIVGNLSALTMYDINGNNGLHGFIYTYGAGIDLRFAGDGKLTTTPSGVTITGNLLISDFDESNNQNAATVEYVDNVIGGDFVLKTGDVMSGSLDILGVSDIDYGFKAYSSDATIGGGIAMQVSGFSGIGKITQQNRVGAFEKNWMFFYRDAGIQLRYDNVTKIETTNTGADIFGDVEAIATSSTDRQLKTRNSIGGVLWRCLNTSGGMRIAQSDANGNYEKNFLGASRDGALTLSYNGSTKLETTSTGIQVTGNTHTVNSSDAITSFISRNSAGGVMLRCLQTADMRIAQTDVNGNFEENWIRGVRNGGVMLDFNGSTKLATTASGVDITGDLSATGKLTGTNTVIIAGKIAADGTILDGTGFTINKGAAGRYSIVYDDPRSSVDYIVLLTPLIKTTTPIPIITYFNPSVSAVTVDVSDSSASAFDNEFSFCIIATP